MARSSTRQELADAAGVSVKTFNKWLELIEKELIEMGYQKGQRLFTPKQTVFICDHFDIERPP
ncbi:MAG: DUF4248 domain-containing protein [Bacteroidales bacterium]|nr:DUF4248 domain-containing protein [Bacteroidales bacterium]